MKTIFYVGRPYPHLGALMQLRESGYSLGILRDRSQPLPHLHLFDYVIDLDFSSEEKFLTELKSVNNLPKIDGLVCSHENYVVFKAIAAHTLGLPSLSIESARHSTDKYAMRQQFLAYNPAITPRFSIVKSLDGLLAFAETATYPLIMKPTNLVKSLLVTKCDTREELINAYSSTVSQIESVYRQYGVTNREPGIIVEEFITGKMCSVAGFADDNGDVFLCEGIVELVTAQERGFDDNFLYSRSIRNEIDSSARERIMSVAREGMKALGMRSTAAHIEIIYDADTAKLVEIGARIGGYRPFLYAQSYDIDLLEQEATVAVGGNPNLSGEFKRYAAMYEIFPSTPGQLVEIKGIKSPDNYEYFNKKIQSTEPAGFAKNGFKAVAILGIVDNDKESFIDRSQQINQIGVVTT